MATYLNPAIIANSVPETAPPNPAVAAETVARIRQLQQQAALAPIQQQEAQAQLQNTQLAAQKAQQQIADQKAFGQALVQSGGDPDKMLALGSQTITDPWTWSMLQNQASMIRERNAKTTSEQNEQAATRAQQFLGKIQAVRDANNPDVKQNLWAGVVQDAMAQKDANGNPIFGSQHFNPNVVPDDNTLQSYQTYLDNNNKWHLAQAEEKARLATAAKTTAAATVSKLQSERQAIADKYQTVSTPEQHQQWQQWVQQTYPDVAGDYKNLAFDPDNTPDTVESMALTPQQRATNEYRGRMADAAATRASVSGGRAGLFARANDPTLPPDQRAAAQQALSEYDKSQKQEGLTPNAQLLQQRYLQKRADSDAKLQSAYQQQEQDEWKMAGLYGNALSKIGVNAQTSDPTALAQTITDPKTGRDISASDAITQMNAARAKAENLADQQTQIRKREGWGEFGVSQQPQGAPAASPATPAAMSPQNPPAAVKSFPRSRLNGFAAANKMTPQQAEQKLIQQGYHLTQ